MFRRMRIRIRSCESGQMCGANMCVVHQLYLAPGWDCRSAGEYGVSECPCRF